MYEKLLENRREKLRFQTKMNTFSRGQRTLFVYLKAWNRLLEDSRAIRGTFFTWSNGDLAIGFMESSSVFVVLDFE